jgi:hypothetical protein
MFLPTTKAFDLVIVLLPPKANELVPPKTVPSSVILLLKPNANDPPPLFPLSEVLIVLLLPNAPFEALEPGVGSATLSLMPWYVKRLPEKASRLTIAVQ